MQEKKGLFAPSFTKRLIFFLGADFVLFFVSLHFSYALRFDFSVPTQYFEHFYLIFFVLAFLKWGSLYLFGVYHLTWRYFSLHNVKQIIFAHILATALFLLIFVSFNETFIPLPRSVIAIDFILSLFLIGVLRLSKRLISEQQSNTSAKPMIIIGSNHRAVALVKSAKNGDIPYSIQGIIAWEPSTFDMCGSYMDAIKIHHPNQLKQLCETYSIQSVAITVDISQETLKPLLNQLTSYNIHDIQRSVILENNTASLKQFSIEDLLARHPKDLDKSAIFSFIQNKTVLITGAGGSIGSEISLQCHNFGAAKLILIEHSEYNLYQIGEKLPGATLRLCNILDRTSLDTIISSEKPDIVVHAAAYKHVPLCEANIQPAIMNNVQGSRNVIDSAIAHNVPKIVIISTDKAVRPANVMGTTKRIVELYAQNVDSKNSEIAAVRFGNVLGSSGSVIPKFKSQIEAGGPITLTHPDITRYFMLISEACQLVLQAAAIAKGKELFILDMGEPVKIIDLARTMIKLYAPGKVEIVMSGLRPGEKLYEELLIDESEQKTSYASIMIAGSTHYPIEQLNRDIESLLSTNDPIAFLKNIVPEFTPDT